MSDGHIARKPRARRKAERPGEILDAALTVFIKEGYTAARLEDVARLAGVTKGTIYFYFESKEKVFEEAIRHTSERMFTELNMSVATVGGPYRERMRSLISTFYKRIAEDHIEREVLRLLISEGRRFPSLVDRHYNDIVKPYISRLREVIEAGIGAGELRNTPALNFPELIFSPALLLTFWILLFDQRQPIDLDRFIEAQLDLLMNGLLASSRS